MKQLRTGVLLVALAAAGCATTGTEGGTRPARQANLLTQEEVRATQQSSLYDVVRMVRPMWLKDRGQISFMDPTAGQLVVFLNMVEAGGVDYLRQVSVLDVLSVQFFDATEATSRFGTRARGGAAIQINTIENTR